MRALGLVGMLIFALPLFMMRLVIKQFMEHTRDHVQQLHEAHEELGKKHTALEHSYDATRTAITGMLRARDDETEGHSERVIALALALGKAVGLTPPELAALEIGAQLHDIGKVGVADAILHKPGPLTPEEWTEMRRHPLIGDELIRAIPFLVAALPVVRHHHERWDGSGYPDGLKGKEIPLSARIFALVDVYDALVSDRPYRRAMSHEAALAEIAKSSGSHFDPECVDIFMHLASDWAPRQAEIPLPLDEVGANALALRRRATDWHQRRGTLPDRVAPHTSRTI